MAKLAVVKTGGKQYLVKEGDELVVDQIAEEKNKQLTLVTLAIFDEEGKDIKLGTPELKETVAAEILEHLKGDKIRVAKFRAKVRYRRTRGFRAKLTKIKIVKI